MRYILLFIIVCLSSAPTFCGACDDTLIALMTANDPNSAFSQGIRDFNRSITALGTALKYRQTADIPGALEKVMETWLAFSNRFNVNPPEAAREDTSWATKMNEMAGRIGAIRKLISAQDIAGAHDAVLALNGRMGILFEAVGMSPLKRRFLTGSELLIRLEQDRAASRHEGMKATCASLTGWLTDFRPTLATDALPPYERTTDAISRLNEILDRSPASIPENLEPLVKFIDANLMDLRARVLMREWFPPPAEENAPATGTGGAQ